MRGGAWRHKRGAILLVVLTITCIGYVWSRVATGNVHTVVPGKLYRSGQLTEGQWATYIQHYGIKSVLNLRGAHRAAAWYQREVRMAAQQGVTHYDVRMSAIRELDDERFETLLTILRQASTPLWIHCRSGADRTGLIAALYLVAIEGQQPETAAQQLSLFYGHFPYLWSRSGTMDRSFWRYVGRQLPPHGGVSNVDIDRNNVFQIKGTRVVISTFEHYQRVLPKLSCGNLFRSPENQKYSLCHP